METLSTVNKAIRIKQNILITVVYARLHRVILVTFSVHAG